MRTGLTEQQSNILSANVKKVAWLFDVDQDNDGNVDYHWSTQSERLGSNLITNYDTESAVMTPVTPFFGTLVQSSTQKYAGSYSAKYTASADVQAHCTYTDVVLGTMYKASVWVYLPSGQTTTELSLRTLMGPANQTLAVTTLTDQWVLLTGYVTATSSTIGVIGNAQNCPGDCWYQDNLSITEVLNPALVGYSFKVMSFTPLVLNMGSPESGVIPPTKTTIRVSFPDSIIDGLHASDFKGASVTIRLICGAYLEPVPAPGDTDEIVATPDYQECEIMAWRFKVLSSSAVNQIMTWECQDFFTLHLEGDYPNTPLVSDLFRADIMKPDNVCVPLAFGMPFMPVRWIPYNLTVTYVDADTFTIAGDMTALFSVGQHLMAYCGVDGSKSCWVSSNSHATGVTTVNLTAASDDLTSNLATVQTDHYLLGASGPTYIIDRARTPIEQSGKTTYLPASYTFKQDTVTGSDSVSYRAVQLICDDANKDGTNDANGFWGVIGKEIYDMPLRFTRSDLATMTSPPNIAEYIWEAWGIPSAEIDAVSQATAVATYAARGLALNIGLWYQQSREKLIAKLFSVSGMIPVIRDTVGFKVLTKTPQLILEEDLIQPGSFSIAQAGYTRTQTDSGYVTWQIGTEPVSQVNKSVVACKSTMVKKSDTTIECEWIQDAVKAQKAGKLALQRSLLKDQTITLTAQAKILQLEPGDMITINPANLGAEGAAYDCLITKMTIHEGLWVDVECTRFSAALDDWDDLSISDIVVSDANTDKAYTPVYQGPGDANGNGSNEINGAVLIGNNGEFKTNTAPATNGGFIATNSSLTCYNTSGAVCFQAKYGSDADQGDVIIGNYAGAQGVRWDQSAGKLDIKGRFTAIEGTMGGFTLGSGAFFNGTNIVLNATAKAIAINDERYGYPGIQLQYNSGSPRFYVGNGSNKFCRWTGSALELSYGKITEFQMEIYTAGAIKTNADPATNGGFLLDSAKMVGYVSGGGERFRVDLSGADIGDVTIGDYSGGQGIKWDQSASLLKVKVTEAGGIEVGGGGDIVLTGSDTDPGRINFSGTSYATQMGLNASGGSFLLRPNTDNVIDLYLGSTAAWWGDGDTRFQSINLNANKFFDVSCGDFVGAVNGAYIAINANLASSTPIIQIDLYDKTAQTLTEYYFLHSFFGPNGNKTQDCGRSSYAWDDVYADDFQNVADFLFLDHRQEKGELVPVDDLEIIKKIKPSGNFDPLGLEIIDDNTLPEWLLSKCKKTGAILRDPDGKPYLSLKTVDSLLMGAIRQIAKQIENLKTEIEKMDK